MTAYPPPFAGRDLRAWIAASLPLYELTGPRLPKSIGTVVRLGVFLTKPESIVLYGSQARGDARSDSDFDLAFFGMEYPDGLIRLRADVEDEPITLRRVDLLDEVQATPELLRNIESEGVKLYGRESEGSSQFR